MKKLASPRSRAESEHETMRAGLRIHHSGVTFGIECDNALKNGGFAAAREGVDDMDWGVRHGHRGQNAPLLLVNDSQSGRQALRSRRGICCAWVFLETPSLQWPVKLKAARAGPRSDASLCLSVMIVATAGPA